MRPRRPGAGSASTGWTSPRRSPLCETHLRANISTATPDVQRHPSARPAGLAQLSAAIVCERWSSRQPRSCSATPPTPPISRSARAPSSRSRMRSSSPRCSTGPASSREPALAEYQAERNLEVLKLQNSARNSTEWFETLDALSRFRADPVRLFAAHPHAAGQPREPAPARQDLARGRRALVPAERASGHPVNDAAPPMFAPFRLRELELANRVVVSPMAMYSAEDGIAGRLPPRPSTAPAPRAAPASSSPR